jgi:PAS domain S-box-containing protein
LANVAHLNCQELSSIAHLAQVTPLGFLSVSPDFRILEWNPGAEHTFGWSRDEVIGRPVDFMISPEDYSRVLENWQKFLVDNQTFSMRNRNVRKDGTIVYCDWYNSPILDANGNLVCVSSICADVTRQVESEASLRMERERFESLVDNLPGIVFQTEMDANLNIRVRYVSDAGAEFFEPESLENNGCMNYFMPAELPRYKAILQQVFESCVGVDSVFHMLDKHRNERYMHYVASTRRIESGDVVIDGVLIDVSNQYLAVRDLNESRTQLERIIQLSSDGFWDYHIETGQMFWSRRCCELFGLPTDSPLSADTIRSRIHPEDAESLRNAWQRAAETGTPYEHEIRVVQTDGSYRWIVAKGTPIFSAENKAVRIIGSMSDVHDAREARYQLSQLNQDLEQRVAERTAALNRMVHELQSFCHSVSHDLRAPLRSINGHAHEIDEHVGKAVSPEVTYALQRIQSSTIEMSELIDALLAMARLSQEQIRLTDVDLTAIAEDVAADTMLGFPNRTVEWHIEKELVAKGDSRLLGVVLRNLFLNALKFTGTRPVAEIRFGRIVRQDQPSFVVSDNGVGFDPRFKERLFRPFERLHSKDEFPGNGIGLANVQRIILRHGGTVWAESVLGEGASFGFNLPE